MSDFIFKFGVTMAAAGLLAFFAGVAVAVIIHPPSGGSLIFGGLGAAALGIMLCIAYMIADLWRRP